MRTADFDYELPHELIASQPLPRATSRLLRLPATGPAQPRTIAELPRLLRPGDLMVLNNTRVIPARLFATRADTGGKVEILVTEELDPLTWRALARPARRLREGVELDLEGGLAASVVAKDDDGSLRLRFSQPLAAKLDEIGHVPLPPYIDRPDSTADRHLYQTVYASRPGAVAAPTAGLHLSRDLLAEIREAGVEIVELTLHVGPGTFKPVKVDEIDEHRMDEERYSLDSDSVAKIERARAAGRRVVAVGTTVVRALESAALRGNGVVTPGDGRTALFIVPGFRFQVVDLLLTNFHLPRSTLLMLVSALAGRERVLAAYAEAIRLGFRFYSFGDAMLVEWSPRGRYHGDATDVFPPGGAGRAGRKGP